MCLLHCRCFDIRHLSGIICWAEYSQVLCTLMNNIRTCKYGKGLSFHPPDTMHRRTNSVLPPSALPATLYLWEPQLSGFIVTYRWQWAGRREGRNWGGGAIKYSAGFNDQFVTTPNSVSLSVKGYLPFF